MGREGGNDDGEDDAEEGDDSDGEGDADAGSGDSSGSYASGSHYWAGSGKRGVSGTPLELLCNNYFDWGSQDCGPDDFQEPPSGECPGEEDRGDSGKKGKPGDVEDVDCTLEGQVGKSCGTCLICTERGCCE